MKFTDDIAFKVGDSITVIFLDGLNYCFPLLTDEELEKVIDTLNQLVINDKHYTVKFRENAVIEEIVVREIPMNAENITQECLCVFGDYISRSSRMLFDYLAKFSI